MVFHKSLSDTKSPHVSRTFLSILVDLNNDCKVSTPPLISKSTSPFINSLVTAPRATITIDINVTSMFYSFSIPKQGLGTYFSFHFHLILLCGQPGQQSLQFCKFSFFFVNYSKVWSSGWDYVIRLYVRIPEKFVCLIV